MNRSKNRGTGDPLGIRRGPARRFDLKGTDLQPRGAGSANKVGAPCNILRATSAGTELGGTWEGCNFQTG